MISKLMISTRLSCSHLLLRTYFKFERVEKRVVEGGVKTSSRSGLCPVWREWNISRIPQSEFRNGVLRGVLQLPRVPSQLVSSNIIQYCITNASATPLPMENRLAINYGACQTTRNQRTRRSTRMPLRRNNSQPVHTDWQPKPRRLRRAAPEAARSSTNEATPTLANCSTYCIGPTNLMNHSFL